MNAAQTLIRHFHGETQAQLTLTYEARFLRRRVLTTDAGEDILLDLEQTMSLDQGDALVLDDGRHVAIKAAPEPLLEVTGSSLVRLAWHIGNRHTPCQVEATRLLIQPDHVIRDMLGKLGATITETVEPFTPEGGAYGHGRTHSHAH
ncbi:MAG TPA: urease accessory protein UreE [Marivita sp.]|nr:urease accessory protein UreE [Marivita sp.]